MAKQLPRPLQPLQDGVPPVAGRGLAHMEKNWGHSFPDGWIWAQGMGSGQSCGQVQVWPEWQRVLIGSPAGVATDR